MLDSNLLAHAASAHPSLQYSPAVPSRDFDSFPARTRAAWPKALRLRSESCAAVSPDSPCCASRPPDADSAQPEGGAVYDQLAHIEKRAHRNARLRLEFQVLAGFRL